ncbi:hypothetical protein H0H93_002673 [Arthromyces matolae]|nr:hypothetical protein H0H93_002673 [Arthromyces matolae]
MEPSYELATLEKAQETTPLAGDSTTYNPSTLNEDPSTIRRRTTVQEPHPEDRDPLPRLSRFATMMTPPKKLGTPPGFFRSILSIMKASSTFLAIVPLAKLLAFATDELSIRVGQTLAGLLNATLGNAVELIVAIIALIKCELRVVQASLLVLGMCFFAGGIKYSQQGFGASATQLNSSLLTISVIAVLLPAAYHLSSNGTDTDEGSHILALSRGAAIILLFSKSDRYISPSILSQVASPLIVYGGYLFFQLYSHTELYSDESADVMKSTAYEHGIAHRQVKRIKHQLKSKLHQHRSHENDTTPPPRSTSPVPLESEDVEANANGPHEEKEEEETPQMNIWTTLILLATVTVLTSAPHFQLVAVTAEFLVDSIDGMTAGGHIGKEFVGIILLPIVGNAAEHVTAVTVSVKDKLTLSIGVAVGSSIQIALFVIPFIVTLGWILGKPLTLLFDTYESVTLFLAVLTVNYVIQDGRSNWLEGFILMCLYVILGLTFWFYPGI